MTETITKNDPQNRTYTFSWEDPLPVAAAARSMSGLEFLTKMANQEVPGPPVMNMIGFRLVKVTPGAVAFTYSPAEQHYNPIGTVHGGILSTVLDSALGCCIHSTLPAGVGYTTLEIKVNFVRAVLIKTGDLRCEANVIHSGSRIVTSEGRLVDSQGKLYAHASTTCLVVS